MKIDDRLLIQALINSNDRFMEELPEVKEAHDFSRRFEKNMNHLISASNKYGGHIWLEKCIRYATKAAIIAVSFLAVNFVSVKAFDFDIWQVVVTKTTEFININFRKVDETEKQSRFFRYKMKVIPDGYEQQEFYQAENMSVQHFISDKGTITYTESLITETANVNILSGAREQGEAGNHEVSYIAGEESLTAFFCDEKFYHILIIQGEDANRNFADKIIEELEEQ